jgi:2-polyprenyl-3-methyl-5-hydroxy-6-metoxy-1,4-benzoquinol methylase
MLPSHEALRAIDRAAVKRLFELHVDPHGIGVITRCLELRLFERLERSELPRGEIDHAGGFGHDRGAHDLLVEAALAFGLIEETAGRLRNSAMTKHHLLSTSPVPLLGLTERYGMYSSGIGNLASTLRFMRASDRTLWSSRSDVSKQDAVFAQRQRYSPQADPRRRYFWDTASVLALPHLDRAVPSGAVIVDVGCALGSLLVLLSRIYPGARVSGVDIDLRNPDYLEVARALIAEERADVELLAANVLASTADVPAADLVTGNRILSGVTPALGAGWASTFFGLLKPGGAFVGVDFLLTGEAHHDAVFMRNFLQVMSWNYTELTQRPVYDDMDERVTWGWTSPWQPHDVHGVLTGAGFVDVEVKSLVPPLAVITARRPA